MILLLPSEKTTINTLLYILQNFFCDYIYFVNIFPRPKYTATPSLLKLTYFPLYYNCNWYVKYPIVGQLSCF